MLTQDTLLFLADLKANNNREWFLDNKKRYEIFKQDYLQLTTNLLMILSANDSSLSQLDPKKCIFRINRDVRFSKDKSPYKTHLGIWFSSGAKSHNRAGYYVQIEANNCFIAGGMYAPEANELKQIRKEIAFFYDDLEMILADKNFKTHFNDLDFSDTNALKNAPKDFEKDHHAIKYLKLKSFTASQNFDISAVVESDFIEITANKLLILKPLNQFINRALMAED